MTPPVRVIGYASGYAAENKGAALGPDFCQQHHFVEFLQSQRIPAQWGGIMTSQADHPETHVCEAASALADAVAVAISDGHFPLTIGGDHAMAIGTWAGVIRALDATNQFGLLWVDAHMDAHNFDTSDSGNIHGMPLAFLLGQGSGIIAESLTPSPLLSQPHTVLFGTRSFEPAEQACLQSQNIRYYTMNELEERGLHTCWREACEIVSQAPKGWGITIDIDAIDPEDAPATGCFEPNGIAARDILALCAMVSDYQGLRAMEIAEFNPALDCDQKTFLLMQQMAVKILQR